jgi:hypothetical protein
MPTPDPRVDAYIAEAQPFARPILQQLREARSPSGSRPRGDDSLATPHLPPIRPTTLQYWQLHRPLFTRDRPPVHSTNPQRRWLRRPNRHGTIRQDLRPQRSPTQSQTEIVFQTRRSTYQSPGDRQTSRPNPEAHATHATRTDRCPKAENKRRRHQVEGLHSHETKGLHRMDYRRQASGNSCSSSHHHA